MQHDKKVVAGKLHFVLPTAIGATAIVDDVKESELRARAEKGRNRGNRLELLEPVFFHLRGERLKADLQNLRGSAGAAARFLHRLLNFPPLDFQQRPLRRVGQRA